MAEVLVILLVVAIFAMPGPWAAGAALALLGLALWDGRRR